jgi:uncharacterized glyoxalase superfamily protein PhnB
MISASVMQRELYSELGTLAAAYRIEARRHFHGELSALLDEGAEIVADLRSRYWAGRITPAATVLAMRDAIVILDRVSEWDA